MNEGGWSGENEIDEIENGEGKRKFEEMVKKELKW